MFYIETWFRLDPNDLPHKGYIADLFCFADGDDCLYGMGISNDAIRVYIADTVEDLPYEWTFGRSSWH